MLSIGTTNENASLFLLNKIEYSSLRNKLFIKKQNMLKKQRFIKNKEDFICENCGFHVIGSGYTNHCPKCLYSKHVDINPGDRENSCLGLMEPIDFIRKNGKDYIVHKCLKCNAEKLNKVSKDDNLDIILEIMKNKASPYSF
ncbi:MAG: RNHCP domain-containing protein [Bdellovibrionota bacterium]